MLPAKPLWRTGKIVRCPRPPSSPRACRGSTPPTCNHEDDWQVNADRQGNAAFCLSDRENAGSPTVRSFRDLSGKLRMAASVTTMPCNGARARGLEASCCRFLIEHDLFGKPVITLRLHAVLRVRIMPSPRFSSLHRSEIFSCLPKRIRRQSIIICRPNHGPSSIRRRRRMGQDVRSPRGPRCIALVGPFQSGKTTLLEAILARTGAIPRAGSVDASSSVGDNSPEARHHKMGVALTAATASFMGDSYTFIDCPGSVEFAHDMRAALPAIDAAVVVCEADEKKLPQLQFILRELENLKIPRFLFLNKIDRANKRIRETLSTLQPASSVPLVLRQIPIWNGDLIEGFVDLALERAFVYREHKASEVIDLEGGNLDREKEARFSMLEKLADHDDALMEQLLEDIPPPRDAVFDDLARELREGLICPVLLGCATRGNGVLRLMKALRHEAPGIAETAKRLGAGESKDALGYVFKTVHLQHGGKLSLTRLLSGHLDDGATLQSSSGQSARVSGIFAAGASQDG